METMTLTINIRKEIYENLEEKAKKLGLSIEEFIVNFLIKEALQN